MVELQSELRLKANYRPKPPWVGDSSEIGQIALLSERADRQPRNQGIALRTLGFEALGQRS